MSREPGVIFSSRYFEKTPSPGPYSTSVISLLKSIFVQTFLTQCNDVGVTEATSLSLINVFKKSIFPMSRMYSDFFFYGCNLIPYSCRFFKLHAFSSLHHGVPSIVEKFFLAFKCNFFHRGIGFILDSVFRNTYRFQGFLFFLPGFFVECKILSRNKSRIHKRFQLFFNGFRSNTVLFVVLSLDFTPALCFVYHLLHTSGYFICIQNGFTAYVSCRTPHNLKKRCF